MPTAPTLPLHPQGYLSMATNLGIKDTTLDFTVIYSTARAAAAGTFTQSLFCGAPVIVGRERLADGYAQALVINSKNANVATGQRGVEIAREITGMVAAELGIAPERRHSQFHRRHWPTTASGNISAGDPGSPPGATASARARTGSAGDHDH